MTEPFLRFHVPETGPEEEQALITTLRSGWLTTGARVREFEHEFAKYVGAPHAIAVNSGTAALHLALEAVGVARGDEVIVPTWTFAATAEVVVYLGAVPVLVDVDPQTLNISPVAAEAAITERTRAIIPVHYAGQPCDMDAIRKIAQAHGLVVIEDAAHALPARWRGQTVGSLSDLTCFSFYATKTITTGEGGMVTAKREELAERIRMMSLHGIRNDAWKRDAVQRSWYYEILNAGFKYNLTDLAATLGIEQLKKCTAFWQVRERYARLYDAGFAHPPGIERPRVLPQVQHAWHLYPILLDLGRLRIGRAEFIEALRRAGIGTSVHFIPLHLHPYYRERFGYQPGDFPSATRAYERIISLPIYPKMSEADVQRVIEAVRTVAEDWR